MSTTFTGTVGRSVTDFMGERLSVLAFGAKGDGVTDDSAAINLAIQTLTTQYGRKLYLPGGHSYLVNSPIIFPAGLSQIWMVGDGDSTCITQGTAMPAGQGLIDIQGASKVTFDSFKIDPNVTTITRHLYSDFGTDPMNNLITGGTAFWVHSGSSKIKWINVTHSHVGGLSIVNDARTGNIDDIQILNCLFENNRAQLLGLVSGDITGNDSNGNPNGYGSFSGGVLSEGDGTNYSVSNLLVQGCTFRRINGNCLWSHAYALNKPHTNFRYLGNHFEDTGLDMIELGAVSGGAVEGNTGRRIGYCTFDDTSQSTPRYLLGKNATGIDTAGQVRGISYKGNSLSSVNGGYFDLDGFSQGSIEGNECIMYSSGDPQYVDDQIAILGPNNDGIIESYGAQTSNSNNDPVAGTDVTIEGNTFIGMNAGAIRLYSARNCKVLGNNIDHPAGAVIAPIVMGPIGTGPYQRATGNIITNNNILYNPSSPVGAIQELANISAFISTDKNWVYGNNLLGSNTFEFYKDPNSSSSVRLVFSSSQSSLTDISINFMQREGVGNSAVLRVYSQEGSGSAGTLLLNLQDYSKVGTLRGAWSGGVTYNTADIVIFSGQRYWAPAGSTGVAPGTDSTKWVIVSPLLNISTAGSLGTGVVSTGNRLTSVVDDAVVTGKLYCDSFMAVGDTTYADSDANLLPNTVALFRFKSSVGYIETSISTSGGARVWAPMTSSGGSAVAAGPTNSVQFNGGSNILAGNANFSYIPASGLAITVSSGSAIVATGGYVQAAGFVNTLSSWEAFNGATSGAGAYIAGLITTSYASTGGYVNLNVLSYGSYPVPLNGLSSFGGTDVLLWASNANGTTSPLTSVGLNTNSFVDAAAGFYTGYGNYNAIQAPFGGMLTRYLTLSTPTPTGNQYPTISLTAGGSTIYGRVFSSVIGSDEGTLYLSSNLSYSGSAWVTDNSSRSSALIAMDSSSSIPLAIYASNGGGLGLAGFQMYNNGNVGIQGSPLGTTGNSLTVTGISGVATIVTVGGFISSAQGFYTPIASVTAINIPSGGAQFGLGVQLNQGLYMLAVGATPTTTVLPNPATGFGAIAYDGGSTYLYWTGSAYAQFNFAAVGGGGGVTSLIAGTAISISASTGAVTVNNTGVTALAGTANEVTVSATTGAITLSLPQAINTAANVIFNAVFAGSTNFNALSTAGGLQVRTGNFNVNDLTSYGSVVIDNNHTFVGSGGVTTAGSITCGTGSAVGFFAGTTKVINNNGTFVGPGISMGSSQGISCGGFNPIIGTTQYFGQNYGVGSGNGTALCGQVWTGAGGWQQVIWGTIPGSNETHAGIYVAGGVIVGFYS
jgi:hypothetical protein